MKDTNEELIRVKTKEELQATILESRKQTAEVDNDDDGDSEQAESGPGVPTATAEEDGEEKEEGEKVEGGEADLSEEQKKERRRKKVESDQQWRDSVHTQHSLDLSTARSQIRSLEASLFQTEQKSSRSERRIADLESELAVLRLRRPSSTPSHENGNQHGLSFDPFFSPSQERGRPSSPFNFTTNTNPSGGTPSSGPRPNLHRRSSSASSSNFNPLPTLPAPFEPLSQRPVDADLPPASRHARRVSLSMLKARMDLTGLGGGFPGSPSGGGMAPSRSPAMVGLAEADSSRPSSPLGGRGSRRASHPPREEDGGADVLGKKAVPQFSDKESLIWCRCCEGDLIVI